MRIAVYMFLTDMAEKGMKGDIYAKYELPSQY